MAGQKEIYTPVLDEYLADFELVRSDLEGKMILDAGAGRRMFAKEGLELGIGGIVSLGDSRNWWLDVLGMMETLRRVRPESEDLRRWETVGRNSVEGFLFELPFAANSFDLILCRDTLIPRIFIEPTRMTEAYRELVRVLMPGGRAIVLPVWFDNWDNDEKWCAGEALAALVEMRGIRLEVRESVRMVAGMEAVGLTADLYKS
ncbi:hypothetical protein A3A84_01725 [Candidatus Collierbacteria bacterium RIFCSPLOWO2_01_FULL_50_23]|uniref:Methyltransferase type 11 domain-containing protein n=1 Tax=Candidatus Collierbacteria bacterium RIFCSPHIGHO2_01_FULL_50_25 TaxID=1817722 RepID=A0A1F5EXC5_9BACT|nr:MAG: hypothetical protein A2703_01975 [Candidatus Collierbacteria bacterium RIFCSPHIGHO2_01_FULL_50_25]OGD73954.1 MAG: hypothetical protein A3A84_01725 [Candidatus Collierbacteria bacterium RIFCSPLOWO2_01_FULL_50_23]